MQLIIIRARVAVIPGRNCRHAVDLEEQILNHNMRMSRSVYSFPVMHLRAQGRSNSGNSLPARREFLNCLYSQHPHKTTSPHQKEHRQLQVHTLWPVQEPLLCRSCLQEKLATFRQDAKLEGNADHGANLWLKQVKFG